MLTNVDNPGYWDERYKNNSANWDLKGANPVFLYILEQYVKTPGSMLIAGSGKGYEAVEASLRGLDVTAVDFSAEAVVSSKELARQNNIEISFIKEDIFNLKDYPQKFDYIYEYTTYCAINRNRRKEFADVISSLLKPEGKLFALVFPIDGREGGPPFSIDIIEFYRNFSDKLKLSFSTRDIPSIKPRKGKELLQIYVKP